MPRELTDGKSTLAEVIAVQWGNKFLIWTSDDQDLLHHKLGLNELIPEWPTSLNTMEVFKEKQSNSFSTKLLTRPFVLPNTIAGRKWFAFYDAVAMPQVPFRL